MNFFDLVAFRKICDLGLYEAKKELSLEDIEVTEIVSALQAFLGDCLFEDPENPSVSNLTERGKVFLDSSRSMVDALFLESVRSLEKLDTGGNVIRMRSDILTGKHLALPSISRVENRAWPTPVKIELLTSEDYGMFSSVNTHVMFHAMDRSDRILFDRRWSVELEQGLYASNEYLKEAGAIPEVDEDLLDHAILGIGDTFDRDIYNITNWHLSGKYLKIPLNPAIMINSVSVLSAAIEADLGIGPIMEYKKFLQNEQLSKVLPDLKGPPVIIEFAVRKQISEKYIELIDALEQEILSEICELGFNVIY